MELINWIETELKGFQFFSNAIGNAIGTLIGGIALALTLFAFGQRLLRPPRIDGVWLLDVVTRQTKFNPFRGMLVRYKLVLVQEGLEISGTAEKVYEEVRGKPQPYTGKNRERVEVRGAIEKRYLGRSGVALNFVHDGTLRQSTSLMRMKLRGFWHGTSLRGDFAHTAGDSYGQAMMYPVPLSRAVDEYVGLPLRWIGSIVEIAFSWSLLSDWVQLKKELVRRIELADALSEKANLYLPTCALVLAEDKRFFSHGGVDPIGIARAIFQLVARRRLQGASTIEQQLVRVLTSDYRRSIGRKIKEIILATRLVQLASKEQIAAMYLQSAYMGWQMTGIEQASVRLKIDLKQPTPEDAARLVARIRHPEPHRPNSTRVELIRRRTEWIHSELNSRPKLLY